MSEENVEGVAAPNGVPSEKEGKVNFEDWVKLDLRVAEIVSVEEIEGADKLWKLTLDVGAESSGGFGRRVICAGIKEFYSKEELEGKKIIYFSNLKPRKMIGVESQGMLLAASSEDSEGGKKVVLIKSKEDKQNGEQIKFLK